MGIEDNALDDQHRCRRKGKNAWQCKVLALPGNIYCAKHRLERDIHNENRKITRPKKGNHFDAEPLLPSGERQCRRNGKGWRCSQLAPPSKIYCQKHELQRKGHTVKKKERRKRKDRGLVESDEMKSSTGDCSTVSKRTKENVEERRFEEVRVESLKRDSRNDVASQESLFPVNEGVVDEHADKTLNIAQIDSAQSLSPILEHQMPSIIQDNDDNQVLPVDPIIRGESTVDNNEQPQSSNEVDDSLNFEYIDNEAVLPLVDMAHSYLLQQEEAPILLESVSCNLPDGRSKTAVKEFVGQKLQFDMMLARFNKRLEAYELEKNAHSKMSKEYRERKDRGLTEFEEMVSSSGHYSKVVKRTKNNEEGRSIEHGRVGSPKRDSGNDVPLEKSLLLANEGVVDEHADKNLSNAQRDSAQLLKPILEERKTLPSIHEKANPSIMEDNDDNQLKSVCPITTGESSPTESTVESVEQPQSFNEVGDSLDFEFTDDEGVLPTLDITCSFVKTSHIWKQIYSMETFKNNPQHPHFCPLENISEEIREGKAIGLMVIFYQLMETTLGAQIDIPETVLINKLNTLADLEQYGFTVQPLRTRLEKLLKIKKDHILLKESLKAAEEEFTNEERHFDEMKESISQLNMKLQQLSDEKEIKEMKVLELQGTEAEVEEKIQRIQVEFDVVAAFGKDLGC